MNERVALTYTTMCQTASQQEAAAQHRELSSVLCDNLDGWDLRGTGGREAQEGREDIYMVETNTTL